MSNVEERERVKYEKVWSHPDYRIACHSLRLWEERSDLFVGQYRSVIDLGCGLGKLIPVLVSQGIDAWGIDLAANCLDIEVERLYGHRVHTGCLWTMELGREFDLGICCDVMEHIPEERVDLTLQKIAKHCREVVFKIAHCENSFLGERLHLTLHQHQWWEDSMLAMGGGSVSHLGTMMRSGFADSLIWWRPER